MVLAWRQHWVASGLVLGLFWLKPDIIWPALFCLGVGIWPDRRALGRYVIGLAAGTFLMIAMDASQFVDWVHSLVGFERSEGVRGLLSEVTGRLHLPAQLHSATFLVISGVAALAVLTVAVWLLRSASFRALSQRDRILWAVALGVSAWLTLTPYLFPNDDLLVLPLLVAMVGADATRAREPVVALAILAMAIVEPLDAVAANWFPTGPNSLVLALVVIAGCYAYSQARSARSGDPAIRATPPGPFVRSSTTGSGTGFESSSS
jgi:hypothetical protein